MKRSLILSALGLVLAAGLATAPQALDPDRFEPEIRKFEEADKASPPPPGAVVFTGSSSIRRWDTLARDFPHVVVLNRGFGILDTSVAEAMKTAAAGRPGRSSDDRAERRGVLAGVLGCVDLRGRHGARA